MGVEVALIFVIVITELIASRLIVGEVRAKVRETDGKNIQRWGGAMLCLIFISLFIYLSILNANDDVIKLFWLCFVIIAFGFKAFLEWRFLKGYKEYMVSLTTLIVSVIFVIFLF